MKSGLKDPTKSFELDSAAQEYGVVGVLESYARQAPQSELYAFVDETAAGEFITVGQLRRDALAAAHYLKEAGLRPGELLLISLEHGYAIAAVFWGALYLGAVPSILSHRPTGAASSGYYEQLTALVEFTGASAIVCEAQDQQLLSASGSLKARLIPKPDLGELSPHPDFSPHRPAGGDTAYIQFSSGTTGTPKGVILTHRAIINYLQTSQESMAITPADVTIGWLPLFHDMGLCTQVLQPVYSRIPSIFLSAAEWLRSPQLLFESVSRYRGTITWMPNFAFNFCLRHVRPEHMQDLDLSSWRILGCGSEPVQMEALLAFADRFAQYGFDRRALSAAYGLAEHVAGVTASPLRSVPRVDWVDETGLQEMSAVPVQPGAPGGRALTSCGLPKPGTEIRIVDESGHSLEDRQVGEVLVRSPSLFSGYYRLPQETAAALVDGWLHTGDLGYMLDGELYICGRKKELIIVRGRNLLPHHIEEIAASVLGKDLRYSVAFGIQDDQAGTELPVLVCEMRRPPDEREMAKWRAALRRSTNQKLQVYLEDVRFVAKGWIVKTTSGKINHTANREKYLREFPPREGDHSPALDGLTEGWTPSETQLHAIWASLLKRSSIGLHEDFFQLGGDSLLAAQVLLEIEAQFGPRLPSGVFFEKATIAQMAALIDRGAAGQPMKIAVPIQPALEENGRPIFFCVHAIRGGVLGYWTLSRTMGSQQPFYGLQARGVDGIAPPDDRVETMAARYIEAMREVQPEGPYYIGGYCFGGVVAYEMAQQLLRLGEQVGGLAVIDRYAPRRSSWQSSLVDELRRDYSFLRHLPTEWRKLRAQDAQQRRARLLRIVRRIAKRAAQLFGRQTPLSLDDITDTSGRPPARRKVDDAVVEAYHHYRPKPYPGDLTLIRTPRGLLDPNKAMGWDKLAAGKVTVHIVAGNHETILQPPFVEALAAKLMEFLSRS